MTIKQVFDDAIARQIALVNEGGPDLEARQLEESDRFWNLLEGLPLKESARIWGEYQGYLAEMAQED